MAKKYVPLLVSLNKSDMDGMEEAIQVLRWVLLSHGEKCSTNGIYRKVRKANETLSTRHLVNFGFRISELQMWDVRLCILPCALRLAPFGLLTPDTLRFLLRSPHPTGGAPV